MQNKQIQFGKCLFLVVLFALALLMPAQVVANPSKDELIRRLQADLKYYKQSLEAAEQRMKNANEEGEKVQPLIEPAKELMLSSEERFVATQRERSAAFREMTQAIREDERIAQAKQEVEEAEQACAQRVEQLMPGIQEQEDYQKLAAKVASAQQSLDEAKSVDYEPEKTKREQRQRRIAIAAQLLAKYQGELGTYVQDLLDADEDYLALSNALNDAKQIRLETEQLVAEQSRDDANVDALNKEYYEDRDTFHQARKEYRDLDARFRELRSDYNDAKKDAEKFNRLIANAETRITNLSRR